MVTTILFCNTPVTVQSYIDGLGFRARKTGDGMLHCAVSNKLGNGAQVFTFCAFHVEVKDLIHSKQTRMWRLYLYNHLIYMYLQRKSCFIIMKILYVALLFLLLIPSL